MANEDRDTKVGEASEAARATAEELHAGIDAFARCTGDAMREDGPVAREISRAPSRRGIGRPFPKNLTLPTTTGGGVLAQP